MLDTQVESVHVTSLIIESIYAKVEISKSIFEIVKINLERGQDKNGWWVVKPASGEPYLVQREDMLKLFPIFKLAAV